MSARIAAFKLPRVVLPETLDGLAVEDPRARRSRRDLRRVNRFMGSCGLLLEGMRKLQPRGEALRILELGAGDGTLMLRVARRLSRSWPAARLWLLDRQALIDERTTTAYARLGWSAQPLVLDVLQWAATRSSPDQRTDCHIIVANLFLHHFEDAQLQQLLSAVAARCELFVACEPRRAPVALIGSHLLGAIGTSRLTRHDGVLSVHAGFRNTELSALWPSPHWSLEERAAGWFSHAFTARRLS